MQLASINVSPSMTKCLVKDRNDVLVIHLSVRFREKNGTVAPKVFVSLLFSNQRDAQRCYDLMLAVPRTSDEIFQKLKDRELISGQRLD